jgi:superfamily II DNA/RNA helicase
VICPTRELTAQVGREMRKLGRKHRGLQVLELVGGQLSRPQRDVPTTRRCGPWPLASG